MTYTQLIIQVHVNVVMSLAKGYGGLTNIEHNIRMFYRDILDDYVEHVNVSPEDIEAHIKFTAYSVQQKF